MMMMIIIIVFDGIIIIIMHLRCDPSLRHNHPHLWTMQFWQWWSYYHYLYTMPWTSWWSSTCGGSTSSMYYAIIIIREQFDHHHHDDNPCTMYPWRAELNMEVLVIWCGTRWLPLALFIYQSFKSPCIKMVNVAGHQWNQRYRAAIHLVRPSTWVAQVDLPDYNLGLPFTFMWLWPRWIQSW